MWEALSRYRGLVLVGALLLAPLALLWAQTRAPEARGPVAGLLVDVASIIERGMLAVTGVIDDGITKYVTSVASADELLRLRREAGALRAERVRSRELEAENEELRRLVQVAERIDGPRLVGARVIGRSGAPLTRIARIDRGRTDGVQRGDGVVASSGVVGQVLSVGRHASDVLLLTDPSSALDVVVQRTRARGIVRGTGAGDEYLARVEDFDRLADVVGGDFLVTSGVGSHFPPGLLVGEVLEVTNRDDNLYQRAEVRPAADMARVEHVLVLVRREPERMPLLASESPPEVTDAGPDGAAADLAAPAPEPAKPAPAPEPAKPASAPEPAKPATAPRAPSPAAPAEAQPAAPRPAGAAAGAPPAQPAAGAAAAKPATPAAPPASPAGKPAAAAPSGAAPRPDGGAPGQPPPPAQKPDAAAKPAPVRPATAKPSPGPAKPGPGAATGEAKPGSGGGGPPAPATPDAGKPAPAPPKPEPAKPEPAKPEPAKPAAPKAEPAKPPPPKPDPANPAPANAPAKPAPAKPAPGGASP